MSEEISWMLEVKMILAPMNSFGPHAGRFSEACQPSRFHDFGQPSDAAQAALADLSPLYCNSIGGFNR